MAVSNVSVDGATPNGNDANINWSSRDANNNPAPAQAANIHVSLKQSVMADPGKISMPAQSVGPRTSAYVADVPGLTQGTQYYAVADADGILSADNPGYPFQTTGAPPPVYTVHLIGKGDHDQDVEPDVDTHPGATVHIKAKAVKINDPNKTPVPGITVTFAVAGGTAVGNLPQHSSVTNQNGVAKVPFTAGSVKGTVLVSASAPQADNAPVVTVNIN